LGRENRVPASPVSRGVFRVVLKRPKVLAEVKAQFKRPLKDAAAVNATRWAF
jgi:hypothetical protein